jgi:hypothetical protein
MKVKMIAISIETEDPAKHVKAVIHDVDEISAEIHANAADDKLAHAIAGIIDFAGDAAKVYDDAHALIIDQESVHHLSAHPKKAAKPKAAKKKKKKAKAKAKAPADAERIA